MTDAVSTTGRPAISGVVRRLHEYLMIWVPLLLSAGHLVSFALWTIWISFTPSTLVPVSGWVGLRNYTAVVATRNWQVAFNNLLLFGGAFVLLSVVTGLILAILLDQRIRGENVLRSIFLYPLAVSYVVTGTVWSWLLNPGIGIEKLVHDLGWTSFRFDWQSGPLSSPRSGNPRASPWRSSSPAFDPSTPILSRPRRSMALDRSECTGESYCRRFGRSSSPSS